MIKNLSRGLRAALAVLLVAGCAQGSSGTAATSTPARTATIAATAAPTTAPAATAAPTSAPATAAPPAAAAAGSVKVAVTEINANGKGGDFSPATLQIHVGDTVEWTNSSGNIHNVTFADGGMHSGVMFAGDRYSQVFPKAGTFKYTCTYHPGMDGTIVVT